MQIRKRLLKRQLTKVNIKIIGLAMKGKPNLEDDPEYKELMDKRKLLTIKLYGDDETWQSEF